MRRARQGRNPWHSPQAVLSRDQRRELRRQVSGKAAVDPAHLRLTRDLAQRLLTRRPQRFLAEHGGAEEA